MYPSVCLLSALMDQASPGRVFLLFIVCMSNPDIWKDATPEPNCLTDMHCSSDCQWTHFWESSFSSTPCSSPSSLPLFLFPSSPAPSFFLPPSFFLSPPLFPFLLPPPPSLHHIQTFRVFTYGEGNSTYPLVFSVRQRSDVVSWTIPLQPTGWAAMNSDTLAWSIQNSFDTIGDLGMHDGYQEGTYITVQVKF